MMIMMMMVMTIVIVVLTTIGSDVRGTNSGDSSSIIIIQLSITEYINTYNCKPDQQGRIQEATWQ